MVNIFHVRPKRRNVGNDLIARGVVNLVRAVAGDRRVNIIPVAPTNRGETTDQGFTPKSVYVMNQLASGVILGGGNLFENGQLELDETSVRALRPPLLIVGLSHGRVFDRRGVLRDRTDSMSPRNIDLLCERATSTLVRDNATAELIARRTTREVIVAGCPSLFSLGPERDERRVPTRGVAVVAVRNPELMSVPVNVRAAVGAVVDRALCSLSREGWNDVRIMCNDDRDLEFATRFGREIVFADDVETLAATLEAADLLVSFRLHAFIAAVILGVPAINISYDERSFSMVRTMGLGDWDLQLVGNDSFDEELKMRLENLVEYDRLRSQSRSVRDALRETMRCSFESFMEQAVDHDDFG